MRDLLRRHLFLLIGMFTLLLFAAVAALDRAGQSGAAQALAALMRVLIVPMYAVWLLLTMAEVAVFGPHVPRALSMVCTVLAMFGGFVPYVLLDYLIARRRPAAGR